MPRSFTVKHDGLTIAVLDWGGARPARLGVHAAFEHLPRLTASVAVLAGDRSFVPRERFEMVAAAAGVPLVMVTGDHFFLHEDTARGVAVIEEHLG